MHMHACMLHTREKEHGAALGWQKLVKLRAYVCHRRQSLCMRACMHGCVALWLCRGAAGCCHQARGRLSGSACGIGLLCLMVASK